MNLREGIANSGHVFHTATLTHRQINTNHHIVQAGHTSLNVFIQAAKAVGPNLTRDRLRTTLGNGPCTRRGPLAGPALQSWRSASQGLRAKGQLCRSD
jgi:hypothetical protein